MHRGAGYKSRVSTEAYEAARDTVRRFVGGNAGGDRRSVPGLVRASFGLYNTLADVDALAAALARIARRDWRGRYRQDAPTGDFAPVR